MMEDKALREIQDSTEQLQDEYMATKPGSAESERLRSEILALRQRRLEREQEVYFALEVPEPLALDGLSKSELQELAEVIRKQIMVASNLRGLEAEEDVVRRARWSALSKENLKIQVALDRIRREEYNPGPGEAPVFEPAGYNATAGFVKSQPGNNAFYLDQYRDDPWYSIIQDAHAALELVVPGYNIAQIKAKFGGLRYYVDLPVAVDREISEQAYAIIREAEDRVSRYESEHGQTEV